MPPSSNGFTVPNNFPSGQSDRKYPQLFVTFTGLTYELIRNYLSLSKATFKGHTIHRGQGLGSTGSERQELVDACKIVTNMTPADHVCAAYEGKIYCCVAIGETIKNTIYSDLDSSQLGRTKA